MSATVRVPASSANLGPGYDSFGLALTLYDTFSAEAAEEWSVEVAGEGAGELRRDAGNLVARAMARVFAEAGGDVTAAKVRCENGVPTGRGLGSSSAAIVGGLLLGDTLAGDPLSDEALFGIAAELEGHSDNVAAALYGGLTVCWSDSDGPSCAILQPGGGLAVVAVVSDAPLGTRAARRLLPKSVPHADAAFNVGRAGLLVAGLLLGCADMVGPGLGDRLHEPYRASAVTDFDVVCDALIDAGADGAALSGAGPTVVGLVLGDDDLAALGRAEQVASAAAELLAGVPGRRAPLALGIDRTGALQL